MNCCDDGCGCCGGGHTSQCSAMQWLILGALIVANAYWGWFTWMMFLGIALIVVGAIKLLMPKCPCTKETVAVVEDRPAKRRR